MAAESKQHTTGFDYLRVGLALGVVVVHCLSIGNPAGWEAMWHSRLAPFQLFILPAFFALSGYLVAGSLFRNSIPQFAALRIARIFPALLVEVALCALVLGPLMTTVPLPVYLASTEFQSYFLNMVGSIHYTLPGVIGGRQLNTQLWTIPFELECYIALVALMLVGLVRRRLLLLIGVVAAVLIMTAYAVAGAVYHVSWNVPGRMLVAAFLFGCLVYLYRDRIPHSLSLFGVSAVASYALLASPNLVFLAAAPLAYVTIYVGLLRLAPIPFGDISYGVYLFHFPIARTIHEVSGRQIGWLPLLALTTLLSGLFATVSWRCVEKPVLERKRALLTFVDGLTLGRPLERWRLHRQRRVAHTRSLIEQGICTMCEAEPIDPFVWAQHPERPWGAQCWADQRLAP